MTTAKKYIIVKPGTLSPKDKEKITKNGDIVIEHQYPGDVRIVSESNLDFDNKMLKGFAAGMLRLEVGASGKGAILEEICKKITQP